MSDIRPYAKMGDEGARHARLLSMLEPPAMTPEQAARLAAKVAALGAAPPLPSPTAWRTMAAKVAGLGAAALVVIGGTSFVVATAGGHPPEPAGAPLSPSATRPDAENGSGPEPSPSAPIAAPPASVLSPHDLPTAKGEPMPPSSIVKPLDPSVDDLLRELRLVDGAKSALGRGDAKGALAGLTQHEASFPAGQLRSEREVVAVEALCALGDVAHAERRASALARREPATPYARRALAAVAACRSAVVREGGSP